MVKGKKSEPLAGFMMAEERIRLTAAPASKGWLTPFDHMAEDVLERGKSCKMASEIVKASSPLSGPAWRLARRRPPLP